MTEVWKDIKGYEGLYQVSSTGRVRRLAGVVVREQHGKADAVQPIRERILKSAIRYDGYELVTLCKDGKTKSFLVHKLVANAFISNPNDYNVINHIDEDKTHNSVDNLEWCTSLYNNTYNNIEIRRQENKKKHWKLVNGRRYYY